MIDNTQYKNSILSIAFFSILFSLSTKIQSMDLPTRPMPGWQLNLLILATSTCGAIGTVAASCTIQQAAATYGASLDGAWCDVQGYNHRTLMRIGASIFVLSVYCAREAFTRAVNAI